MEIVKEVINSSSEAKSKLVRPILYLNFLFVLITFFLNFTGSPAVKYVYLVHIFLTTLAVLLFDFMDVLPVIISLFFLEGQGRIVWGNASWTKFIFDLVVMLAVLKIFIKKKKFFDLKKLPKPLVVLCAFHFIWYLFEFSNLDAISYFAFFAATKVYIYPVLFFFALTQLDFQVSGKDFQLGMNFTILLIIMEIALTFFQYTMKEKFILQISPFYQAAMRDSIFIGSFYRPFATSFAPGAISSYLFLTIGFLFFKKTNFFTEMLRLVLIGAFGFAIILCQVRSAFVKVIVILVIIELGLLIFDRFQGKKLFNFILVTIALIFGINYFINNDNSEKDEGLSNVRDRFMSIGDKQIVQNTRLSLPKFLEIASEKLMEKPFGLGPGLTGAVGRLSLDEVKASHFLNIKMVWASDNLLISLLIDFGIGAIFYILVLFYIPVYFFKKLVFYYKNKNESEFTTLLVCFGTIIGILVGNWGAVGLTYNPESFIFWFFAALGFGVIAKFRNGELSNARAN